MAIDIAEETVARRGAGDATPPRRAAGSAGADSTSRDDSTSARSSATPRPSISRLIDDIRAAFSARFYLFELEAKRAAGSAAYMLAFAVGAALLGVTAWLIFIGTLIYGAVTAGLPWVVAAIVAIALHAGGAFLLVRGIRSMVDNLTFAATRRALSHADHRKAQDGSGT